MYTGMALTQNVENELSMKFESPNHIFGGNSESLMMNNKLYVVGLIFNDTTKSLMQLILRDCSNGWFKSLERKERS